VRALTDAAQQGKQVAVLVELQARGDEANNISWARTLESAGVTWPMDCQVSRRTLSGTRGPRETDAIRRYVHIGTGNYNSKTARLYTDFGSVHVQSSVGLTSATYSTP